VEISVLTVQGADAFKAEWRSNMPSAKDDRVAIVDAG
jgi:hypothetical protein